MMSRLSPAMLGSLSALIASMCFTINDATVKFLSGGYPLHEVVLIRSLIGLVFVLVVFLPTEGGFRALRTRRPVAHLLRGLCVVVANMTFFLGIAAMPLAEGVAVFFISPVLITVFSVIFLRETVGPWRWIAISVGFIGVIIMLRPGAGTFQSVAILPLIAATGYALLHMLTRHIRRTETTVAMAVYVQLVFIVVSAGMGLAVGDGRYSGWDNPSMEFLLRPWIWPAYQDIALFVLVGFATGLGGYLISLAYRTAEAALVAPFEYVAMPLGVLSGYLIFAEVPDRVAFVGIALILGSGLVMIWREAVRKPLAQDAPVRR
jgi:drug/metabolite transporter (DMT)-like permease